jgi:probable F420-dependent oxidoreductase
MTTIDLGPTGAVLSPDAPGFATTAGELERIGYDTIWLTGGPMSHLSQVAEAVTATATARIATGIIPVDRFSSDDVAALYGELESTAPGRFVVGLGGAHGADPLGTLNAYLDRLDGSVPAGRRVMAALGPRMMRLARDRAAGAFPVLVTPDYVRQAKAQLPDTTLAVEQLVVLDTDPTTARATARGPLGFLGQVPAYQSSFRRMGFADDDIATLGDALVDGLVAWGDAAAIADRVAAVRAAGADHVAISVVSRATQPSLDEWRAVAEAVAG